MSRPSSRAIEVVRDQLVALVAEVAHEIQTFCPLKGLSCTKTRNKWTSFLVVFGGLVDGATIPFLAI